MHSLGQRDVTTRRPTSNFGPPSGISDRRPRHVPTGVGPPSGSRIAPSSPVPPVCARMRRDSGRFPRSAVLDPEKPRENHGVKPTHSRLSSLVSLVQITPSLRGKVVCSEWGKEVCSWRTEWGKEVSWPRTAVCTEPATEAHIYDFLNHMEASNAPLLLLCGAASVI